MSFTWRTELMITVLLCVTTVIGLIIRFLRRRHCSPLRTYPGPYFASGSRIWKVWSTYGGHTETDHINLHQVYGPVVRIAPNELSFATPQAALDILATSKGFHKTDFYSVFPPPKHPDIFTEVREEVHARKKRIATGPYSLASLRKLTFWVDETMNVLSAKLDDFVVSGHACDLGEWLHFFAFDVLGEVVFSRPFGFLDTGTDVAGTIRTIARSHRYSGLVGQIPWIDHFLRRNPLWQFIGFRATKHVHVTEIALRELQRRTSGEVVASRPDLLSQLMRAVGEADAEKETLTEGDVFAIAHGAIFAGADSTASTMQTFLWHILADRRIYEKLTAELTVAEKAGRLSDNIRDSEAREELPYFQACLQEAMRLRPAVGLNMTRSVPMPHAEVDGHLLPGGTRVAVNAWVLHRNKAIFGEDADVFRPERWILDAAQGGQMRRHMFHFGAGAHLCIGRHLALLEMNKILPQLLRRYRLELVNPEKPLDHYSSFFVAQSGLIVTIHKRE